ncbi:LUD domain-containing protein [Janthinobacterium sp. GW460P]|uniref:LutC/YkgG family protein n=1 Tax=unclassified Janthinobacterium TaxID=2610881 RepID=UPI000A326990|nr:MULTISPECIES: LUD domain-containing protein [unclassified Janthinobacterium]MCC7701040.1 LUD domain-containing protein [Janthinobacterium sp. GW460P]MCC7706547.1 LUD domain-containing protein [Janthinobacterium sp. GW460W]
MSAALSARERMLGRLRAAAPAAPEAVDAIDTAIDNHYQARRAAAPLPARHRIAAMQAALRASHAEVDCVSNDAWPALLAQRLGEHGVRRLLMDTGSAAGRALRTALPPEVETLSFDRPLAQWKGELFDTVDAGFTVARSGIAATGTLVIAPDVATPRTVSLAPPLHICLVYASSLHVDLHAAARAERWADGMPANLVLVSGPSKTSDIQQTLAYGAHGPRWLWVLIVDDLSAHEGGQP